MNNYIFIVHYNPRQDFYFEDREINVRVLSRDHTHASLPVLTCRGLSCCFFPECERLSNRGEHGRRLRQDATGRRGGFFRCRLLRGVAGEQNEEEVSGLEEETSAGKTVRDSEEAGLGLNGEGLFVVDLC